MYEKQRYDIEFCVIWDQSRRAFSIQRSGKDVGRFMRDKMAAIALAKKAAQFSNRDGKTAAVFSFDSNRKRITEWSA